MDPIRHGDTKIDLELYNFPDKSFSFPLHFTALVIERLSSVLRYLIYQTMIDY